jgi:hypothetical protein
VVEGLFDGAVEGPLVQVPLEREHTRDDARNVAVQNRVGLVVSNTQDGPCRVVAHAAERTGLLVVLGKAAGVPRANGLSCLM